MNVLVLDTNAYSDLKRGNQSIKRILNNTSTTYVPVIVLADLKAGFFSGNRTEESLKELNDFIQTPGTQLLEVNEETTDNYAKLASYLKKNGTPIPINDIWIAALCVQYDLPLLTSDSDFKHLPQVKLIEF